MTQSRDRGIRRFVSWLYCKDADRYHWGEKDGTSTFSALAGFAVAQGVALTSVAKAEGRDGLVLFIYFVAVLMTAAWIRSMLCQTRKTSVPDSNDRIRVFDESSTRYGRWTLSWIVLVSTIMIILGWLGLLPNQTYREAFLPTTIPVHVKHFSGVAQGELVTVGGTKPERQYLDGWLKWFTSEKPNATERLVWIEQKSEFQDHYKSFTARLNYDDTKYQLMQRTAFLVGSDEGSARPLFRQMRFEPSDTTNWIPTNRIEIAAPNPGESLVILAYAKPKPGSQLPSDPSAYGFAIEKE
jgi:hypothetical protein